jgi:hypothetical protein
LDNNNSNSTLRPTLHTPSGAVKEVILRVTERAQKEVIVIAQKKMHLRGIELETSGLECLRVAAATNQT